MALLSFAVSSLHDLTKTTLAIGHTPKNWTPCERKKKTRSKSKSKTQQQKITPFRPARVLHRGCWKATRECHLGLSFPPFFFARPVSQILVRFGPILETQKITQNIPRLEPECRRIVLLVLAGINATNWASPFWSFSLSLRFYFLHPVVVQIWKRNKKILKKANFVTTWDSMGYTHTMEQ